MELARGKTRDISGQMTVELMVTLPILIIVAVIAVNALFAFIQCASFDRIARDAVRTIAASPTYEQTLDMSAEQVKQFIESSFSGYDNTTYSVTSFDGYRGVSRFDITLEYRPTLFGMGLKSSVLGVDLPTIKHVVSVAVDPYNPSVVL